jgi:hypothetical protein
MNSQQRPTWVGLAAPRGLDSVLARVLFPVEETW